MAITKTYNVKTKSHLKELIDYAEKEEKTEELLISGMNCNPYNAYEEFNTVKEMYGKSDGRQAYQVVQSFKIGEITPEQAHEIGKKWAEQIAPGYQAVLATHLDRNHIHNHLVINSVNAEHGYMYDSNSAQVKHIREVSDNLCREYGLSIIQEPQGKGKHYGELKAEQDGRSWKSKTKDDIDFIRENTNTKEQFISEIGELGYKVSWEENHKYITFEDSEGHKVRGYRLGEEYTKEALENEYRGKGLNDRGLEQETNISKGLDDSSKLQDKRDVEDKQTARREDRHEPREHQDNQRGTNEEDRETASRGTSEKSKVQSKRNEYERYEIRQQNGETRENVQQNDDSFLHNDRSSADNVRNNNVSDVQKVMAEWTEYRTGQQDRRLDQELINQARQTKLTDYLKEKGYELEPTKKDNVLRVKDTEVFIEIEKNKWKDRATKENGNTIDFVMKKEYCNFRQAVEKITNNEKANEIIERPAIIHKPTQELKEKQEREQAEIRARQQAEKEQQLEHERARERARVRTYRPSQDEQER